MSRPSDAYMREKIRGAYPGEKWSRRVDRMSNEQVAAVYLRLLDQKKI